ncbi:peptidoglycan-binding protein [Bordetella sp. H567]|uniref:N-acetylmuramidase domain-containing protein n=1 Tax=Bordetella sp. H567 TaxID=1697043 RepID=UPI00081CDEDF|nr:N-acetylmuramidase family protein [Bordetella sp. H567]AOB29911.1 peptidoglycan-binding protein [Bordetella sp. H567]
MDNLLTLGATGRAVADLQQTLNRAGVRAPATGLYDEATAQAVRAIQQRAGLVEDGICGPKTRAYLAGLASGRLLTEQDIADAARALDVPIAAIKAVNNVESRGEGFLPDGRPVILFERHVFWDRLKKAGIDPATVTAPATVLCQERGGYAGGAAEYGRLAIAMRIHEAAALESASWGLFQIMGYHWQAMGYSSVADYVERQKAGEGEQLQALVRFLNANPTLLNALRAQKWPAFAKGYNGADYAANLYDAKLARAFDRFTAMHPAEEPA